MNKLNKIEPFKELLLRAEPRLSAAESNDMWSGIEKRLAAKSRFTKSAVWRAAAVVSLLLASAWVAYVAWSGSSDERFFTRQLPDSYAQASIRFEDRLIEVEHDAVISWNLAERKLEINQGNTKISLQSESEDGCMMAFVPTGNKIILKLADGSQVTLREGSKLMFPLRFGDVRHVDLQGEAYVKVTKDMHRPFTVKSDLLAVTVLGTEFLFSAYPESEEQKVALVEGLVEVTPHEGKAVRLHPNETYTYRRTKETFVVGKNEAIDELGVVEGLHSPAEGQTACGGAQAAGDDIQYPALL